MSIDIVLFDGGDLSDTSEETASVPDVGEQPDENGPLQPEEPGETDPEDSGVEPPDFSAPAIDVEMLDLRSLVETDQRALTAFTMNNVLSAIIQNSDVDKEQFNLFSSALGLPSAAHFMHDQFMDTYTANEHGSFAFQHCDDEMNAGVPALNGYPIECSRLEAEQQGNIDAWKPIALFNRLDIAPVDGHHCGEQRLVMANNVGIGGGRFFLIFESQIPNPNPQQGLQGCAPIASFWGQQSLIPDPADRGEKLRQAFLTGNNPELKIGGFSGFMSASNFTDGAGQIRSNNFNSFTWSLREHKLNISDTHISSRTVPVSNNLFGAFWADKGDLDNSALCREEILAAVDSLSSSDPNDWEFTPDSDCWAAESEISFQNDYIQQLAMSDGALINDIEAIAPASVSAFEIAARAQFAGNCMGCHESSNFTDLGEELSTPQSLGFVHVSESLNLCDDGTRNCFRLSNALTDDFLPARFETLQNYINAVQNGDLSKLKPYLPGKAGRPTIERTLGGDPVGRAH